MSTKLLSIVASLALFAMRPGFAATIHGPSPYAQLADSPFFGMGLVNAFVEDWEDNALSTPGVSMSGVNLRLSSTFSNGLIDSVDADDGVINGASHNGAGHYGQAQWANGNPGITFEFSGYETLYGRLPTHAGIVWTDGEGTINFEARGPSGIVLGTLVGNHANGSVLGETVDDRFYGVSDSGGIRSIRIWNTAGGIEVDHLQYGMQQQATSVPEQLSGLPLLAAVFALCVAVKRRERLSSIPA